MCALAYIVDFTEPGQVADAYHHYFVNSAFLLSTADELKLSTQIRLRFNFPDGHGTTVVARVVSVLPGQGYGLQLPANEVMDWVLGKAKTYADKTKRIRKSKPRAMPQVDTPLPDDTTTRRIDRPPARPVMEASLGEQTGEIPPPSTKPVRKTKPTPPVSPDQEGAKTGGVPDPAAAAKAELARRVAHLDRWVAQQMEDAPPGATVQAAPPGAETAAPAPAAEPDTATQQEIEKASRARRILQLSDTQKKKLAISGGVDERRVLMQDVDDELHIWVLKNPSLTEEEVVGYSQMTNLSEKALNFLLQNRRWGTCAPVARNLALNSRTPPEAIPTLLTVLPVEDLKALAATPGIRHLVARQARRILMEKSHI